MSHDRGQEARRYGRTRGTRWNAAAQLALEECVQRVRKGEEPNIEELVARAPTVQELRPALEGLEMFAMMTRRLKELNPSFKLSDLKTR